MYPFLKKLMKTMASNYSTIMFISLLAKLYGIILENEINIGIESQAKRDKVQSGFRRYHSTIYHLITLKIIVEECCNNKPILLCCLVDFRKYFDTMRRNNLWKMSAHGA